jgi:hypothetical protein
LPTVALRPIRTEGMRYRADQCRLALATQTIPIERRNDRVGQESNVFYAPIPVTDHVVADRSHPLSRALRYFINPLSSSCSRRKIEQLAMWWRPQGIATQFEQAWSQRRCLNKWIARADDSVHTCREWATNRGSVRISLVTDIGKHFYDRVPSTERKRPHNYVRGKNTLSHEIRLYANDFGKKFAGAVGLVGLNDNRTPVLQNNARYTADARLVKQTACHREAKI